MKSFNLLRESWVSTVDAGECSLLDLFDKSKSIRQLGGNPLERIAMMKLLLAIAQAACTPKTDAELEALTVDQLREACFAHLGAYESAFDLYSETEPFLQMLQIAEAGTKPPQPLGAVLPHIATGNATILNNSQIAQVLSAPEQARLLVTLSGHAFAGKKVDNTAVLTKGYKGKQNDKGKASSGKAGPGLGYLGYLHTFIQGPDLMTTLLLNLLSEQAIKAEGFKGVGSPQWVTPIKGEDCKAARALKTSYMGRLVPMNRFCLLTDEQSLYYSEGVAYPTHKDGGVDTSVTADLLAKDPKALWANPNKRPWREITSLLSVFSNGSGGMRNALLTRNLGRVRDVTDEFGLLSLGIRVSANAGEQYLTGTDDFVESLVTLRGAYFGQQWYPRLSDDMAYLDHVAKVLYACVAKYYSEQRAGNAADRAARATQRYWESAEPLFKALMDACAEPTDHIAARIAVRKRIQGLAKASYEIECPARLPQQYVKWAEHYPRIKTGLEEAA